MEPHCPLQVLNIRSSLPHLRVIVLYGDEEVPAEVTKQYHMSPKPFAKPYLPILNGRKVSDPIDFVPHDGFNAQACDPRLFVVL